MCFADFFFTLVVFSYPLIMLCVYMFRLTFFPSHSYIISLFMCESVFIGKGDTTNLHTSLLPLSPRHCIFMYICLYPFPFCFIFAPSVCICICLIFSVFSCFFHSFYICICFSMYCFSSCLLASFCVYIYIYLFICVCL